MKITKFHLKSLLTFSSMIFYGYATILLLEEKHLWLATWVICSMMISLTIKQDIIRAIKDK